MYREVKLEQVQEILDKEPARYFDEREELEDISLEDNTRYYLSDDVLLIFSPQRIKTLITAVPLKTDFDLTAMEDFINKRSDRFMIHLNVTGINAGSLRFNEPYVISDPYKSYWTDGANQAEIQADVPGRIRPLTDKDTRYVRSFPDEGDVPGMKLRESFSIYTDDDIGTILGYFSEEGFLLGYLSYTPSYLDAYSVDGIFVTPASRRQGIGTALAQKMIEEAHEQGMEAYWPVAQTELVEKTAEKAGFSYVASRITIESV